MGREKQTSKNEQKLNYINNSVGFIFRRAV